MNVQIYVDNRNDTEMSKGLRRSKAMQDVDVEIVNVEEAASVGLPAKVLSHIVEHGQEGLPLTLVDGTVQFCGELPEEGAIDSLNQTTITGNDLVSGKGFTECDSYAEDSSVDFPTRSRIHLNLVVSDLESSINFYRVMLGQEPTKVKSGYAKFETEDPPLNLALQEDPHGGANSHFGIQVKATSVIRHSMDRYHKAGFRLYNEGQTSCCYALQDKTWVVDPDGRQWEVYAVLDNATDEGCEADCICYQDLQPSVPTSGADPLREKPA